MGNITLGPIRAYLRKKITAKGEIAIGTAARLFSMVGIAGKNDGDVLRVKAAEAAGWDVGPATDPDAVPKSTLSAKGSLIGATAASTPVGIPTGIEGATLTPRDEQTAGIDWQPGFGRSAHVLSGGVGPFDLEPAEKIDFAWSDESGESSQTVTFNAAAAQLTSGNSETFNLDTLVLETDKGNVTFVGNGLTAAQVATQIDAQTTGITSADDGGGFVELTTTQRGTGASLNVTGGTANAILGFSTSGVSGTGDVIDIDAVTASEVAETINDSGSLNLSAREREDGLVEAYVLGGRAPETRIQAEATTTATAIGFDNDFHHASSAGLPTLIGNQSEPFAPSGGETLVIERDSDPGTAETVTLQASDTTASLVVDRINGTSGVNPEVVASVDAGKIKLVSNTGGSESSVSTPSGTAKTLLGFDDIDTAFGDDGTYDAEALGVGNGGGGVPLSITITGDETLTGTDDILAKITLISGNMTIDLPPASGRDGQLVLVVDESKTAGENGIVKVAGDGSDKQNIPGAGQCDATSLGRNGAFAWYESDGVSAWSLVGRDGVGVDIRTIPGLMADWDLSRGYTLSGSNYATLADQSGNGHSLTASGSFAQKIGRSGRLSGRGLLSTNFSTDANFVPTSGELTVFGVLDKAWGDPGGGDDHPYFRIGTSAAGTGFVLQFSTTGIWDSTDNGIFFFGAGWTSAAPPRVDSPLPLGVTGGMHSGIVMARIGAASSEIKWNDMENLAVTLSSGGATNLGADAVAIVFYANGNHYRKIVFDDDMSRANQVLVDDAMTQAYPFVGR